MKAKISVGIKKSRLRQWKEGDYCWVMEYRTYKSMWNSKSGHTREHMREYVWYTITATLPRFFGSRVVKGVMENAESPTS